MLNKLLIQLGAVAILLTVIGALWLSGNAARAERDLARANYEQAHTANQTLLATLDAERAERERIERVLADRIRVQREIERETAEKIRRKDAEIEELRRQHAEVDDYLAIPVPDAYLDWLRQQAGGDADRDGKDVSTGSTGTAES
ncbi:MAG: hypothetical protein PHQ43_01795 [Dehalococcoidales bacterium]|nr:hypothetical protein [Dehalococcoidales bacterium]